MQLIDTVKNLHLKCRQHLDEFTELVRLAFDNPKNLVHIARRMILVLIPTCIALVLVLNRETISAVLSELPLIYNTDHLQTTNSGELTIMTYGPQLLVEEEVGNASILLRNDSTSALADIHISIFNSTGEARVTVGDPGTSNSLAVDELGAGANHQLPLTISLAQVHQQIKSVDLAIVVNYRRGGLLDKKKVVTDIDLLKLNPEISPPVGKSVTATALVTVDGHDDLSIRALYTPKSNNDQDVPGLLDLSLQSLQPALDGLRVTIYTVDAAGNPIMPDQGTDSTNVASVPTLLKYESRSQKFRLDLPSDYARSNMLLRAHLEYDVARTAESIVSNQANTGFTYGLSQFPNFHRFLGQFVVVGQGSASTLNKFVATITTVLTAIVGLGAAFGIAATPLRKFLGRSKKAADE